MSEFPALSVPFRIPMDEIIKAASNPKAAAEIVNKHKISKEELAKEIERLAKVLAISGSNMICV